MKRVLSVCALAALIGGGLAAAPPRPGAKDTDVIERIRAIFRSARGHVDRDAGEEMFAAPDSDAYVRGDWHKLRAIPTDDPYIATIYCVDGHPVMFKVEINAEDWNNQAEFYLYPTGTVAFRFETLRTFHGRAPDGAEEGTGLFIVEDRQYFDDAGKLLRHLESAYVDNKAKTPVEFEDIERRRGPTFQAVEQTPFYKLSRCRPGGLPDAGR